MTMVNAAHPDPERLAALAGNDADARADAALTEHVASCAACGRQVQEMSTLRAALSALPDLTPSRPFQLVPPVAAPEPSGWRIAFRRAFAPMAVAGMVLLLVGGVGATGALGPADAQRLFIFSAAQQAGAPAGGGDPEITTDDGGAPAPAASDSNSRPLSSDGVGAMAPTPEGQVHEAAGGKDAEGTDGEPSRPRSEDLDAELGGTSGWLVLVAAGLALLLVAFVLLAAAPKRVADEL